MNRRQLLFGGAALAAAAVAKPLGALAGPEAILAEAGAVIDCYAIRYPLRPRAFQLMAEVWAKIDSDVQRIIYEGDPGRHFDGLLTMADPDDPVRGAS